MNIFITSLLFLIPIFLLLSRTRKTSKRIPPGSLGIPVIGQSLGLLRAMRANTAENWFQERIREYGPVSKLSLFGKPTVFIYGQAANKFVFTSNNSMLANQQTQSFKMILGDRNLLELSGPDHKRVREALLSFLRPESLKQYVGRIGEEIRKHLEMYWQGKQQVTVLPLMKILTSNIICSLLFGLEEGTQRDKFVACFEEMVKGIWAVPINLPFTRYNRGLRESARVQDMMKELVHEKRLQLEGKSASPHQDLITFLLSIRDEDGKEVLSEKEIVQNGALSMVAGYETSAIAITFIIRLFANEPAVCAAVLQEQQEIAKSKASGESLTWDDLAKMKYTWRVAMETLRMFPPVFGGFRKALTDIEYDGYLIPKGWQIFWVAPMTHMDNSIFPEPSKFDPSRFEKQASVPPFSFIPFGGGPRMCPGNELVRIEILITIHYLVTHYEWKLAADNLFSRDPMPEPSQGLPIKVWPRELS
ncbi:Cytochrome P450 family protein [Quillaja saponaria]|uniref:Cytochrome P450 family protein n=1 Tax=Quillaja saponaria TaxID=32244 RepID=A0AAD7LNT2_QUISA|nr:Cytochrome P450 family protein [Quillaja saponaria]